MSLKKNLKLHNTGETTIVENYITLDPQRNELATLFQNHQITHGTFFDNGRRWCSVCECTRLMCDMAEHDPWIGRTCADCTAIWPEYMQEITDG